MRSAADTVSGIIDKWSAFFNRLDANALAGLYSKNAFFFGSNPSLYCGSKGFGSPYFNAFLNRYRIEEAKAALADPEQKDVPLLAFAMDAGFQSTGPFNRAFKAATDVTPTEFRRLAVANNASHMLKQDASSKIGKSG